MPHVPDHQKRINPTLGDWLDALLLVVCCSSCGLPLQHRRNVQWNHSPPLADRFGAQWIGIHTNDPRYITFEHADCHQALSGHEHTNRSKAKRNKTKHEAHQERMRAFPLPTVDRTRAKYIWPSRPFQKRKDDGRKKSR